MKYTVESTQPKGCTTKDGRVNIQAIKYVSKMLQSKVGSSAEYKDKVESANPKAGNVPEQQSGESLQSIKPG